MTAKGQSTQINVRGMTCEHCVRRVKRALEGLSGIENVVVSLDEEKATFIWDSSAIDRVAIHHAIEEAGYEVDDPEYKDISVKKPGQVSVYGMTCQHCVNRVAKALEKLPGMENIKVSLDDSRADFNYDPNQVKEEEIQRAIEEAGYSITPLP
ncbi:MAG: copper ion binding protein, partial [Bacillota bacterium]|nr:copper ion binding protein [Bacillota bacterium]